MVHPPRLSILTMGSQPSNLMGQIILQFERQPPLLKKEIKKYLSLEYLFCIPPLTLKVRRYSMNITSFPQCNYNVIIGNHRTDVCDQNILNILSTISNVAMKILATIFLDWIISF